MRHLIHRKENEEECQISHRVIILTLEDTLIRYRRKMKIALISFSLVIYQVAAFVLPGSSCLPTARRGDVALSVGDEAWNGEVVSNSGGSIRGCSIQQVGDSITDWIITIDG